MLWWWREGWERKTFTETKTSKGEEKSCIKTTRQKQWRRTQWSDWLFFRISIFSQMFFSFFHYFFIPFTNRSVGSHKNCTVKCKCQHSPFIVSLLSSTTSSLVTLFILTLVLTAITVETYSVFRFVANEFLLFVRIIINWWLVCCFFFAFIKRMNQISQHIDFYIIL